MAERNPRELDTRAKAERPKQWMVPDVLPHVNEEPGYAMRWIRVSTLGNADPRNVSMKLQEGWEPVKASDHPETYVAETGAGRFPDSIQIGGLMLCKTPKEFVDQRSVFFQRQADGQMASVDNNYMRESDPRMPLFRERKSEVSFGRGS
jgi:hypothetical protein